MRSISPHEVRNLDPLQRDILSTILYFDIFRHPLTAEEVYRFLPSNSTSPSDVRASCRTLPLSNILQEDDGFFFLAGENPVTLRRENEARAGRYMKIARFMAGIIRFFPFVRGLGVSGELSKGVVSPHGDIDYFVVTAPRRVWITRTMLILFKKLVLLNRKKFFCLNHFVAEDRLDVTERNRYTALEIATLEPLLNEGFFLRYRARNEWIRSFYPNLPPQNHLPADERTGLPGILQRLFEFPLKGALGDALDRRLMEFWRSVWRRRYGHLPQEKLHQLFRSDPSISTAYAGDFLTRILDEHAIRLDRYGISSADTGLS